MRPGEQVWSEPELSLAARLWKAGFSGGDIARRLAQDLNASRSRSAVIGLVHRRPELFGGEAKKSKKGRAKARSEAAQKPAPKKRQHLNAANIAGKRGARAFDPGFQAPIAPSEAREYDARSRRVPLTRLGVGCKFPVNDAAVGEEHLFCGHPAKAGSPYCAHHSLRASVGRVRLPEIAEVHRAFAGRRR
ncbi:GcrA family cell cycle regulator [Chelativorans sp.]|uniref:GcrA family cell cycle regulator n=1 Tax=Chelativorans sp. TaxID=2203393 RepID=UPI002811B6EF|nr:GcrA family cell cycle regulator [Chelativorans sp.]